MGYALYGHEIDRTITPLEAGLSWIVKLEKGAPFVGDRALRDQQTRGVTRKMVGFKLLGRGIPRPGYPVWLDGRQVDVVRSGGMSPSLAIPIGTTFLPVGSAVTGTKFEVECRGERLPAEVVSRPFWKNGTCGEAEQGPEVRVAVLTSPTPAHAASGPIPRATRSSPGPPVGATTW
jgi:aminomethyltransferase